MNKDIDQEFCESVMINIYDYLSKCIKDVRQPSPLLKDFFIEMLQWQIDQLKDES